MIRATTGGVMKTYRSNLMNSFINMNHNRNTVLSQRIFNSFAEDPAAAAKAFRLRKSRMMVESQYEICSDAHKKYETAVACLQSIDDILCTKEGEYGYYMKTLTGTTLSMLNDPEGDARTQLSKVLDQMSQSIIQTMNQKYGDNFIFAGADGHNVPFEIVGNKLYYRGVPVDASVPNVVKDASGNFIEVNAQGQVQAGGGNYLKADNVKKVISGDPDYTLPPLADSNEYDINGKLSTDPDFDDSFGVFYKLAQQDENGNDQFILKSDYEQIEARLNTLLKNEDGSYYPLQTDEDGSQYYWAIVGDPADAVISKKDYDTEVLNAEKLQYLANETCFVDIGYGFQEDPVTGKLIESSAFDVALNGINFMGWGLDEDGDPKNLYSLVQKMRQVADSVPEAGKWDIPTWNEFDRLVGKFEKAVSNYQTEFVDLDASTGKLKNQGELLLDNFDNLQEQYSDIEDVDMVDAITSFIWAEYCYNAALKVGNSILSESLMDYLR